MFSPCSTKRRASDKDLPVYTRTMKNLIIFSALIVLASAYPKDLLHAECSVKW
jgi:hypothetical protein